MKCRESRGPLVVPAIFGAPHGAIERATGLLVALALLHSTLLRGARADAPGQKPPILPKPPVATKDEAEKGEIELEESTFSLTVRDAPLTRVLSVLSATTPLRFRYAAPPDAVVSANFLNVPLLPTLEMLLRGVHWRMRRDGTDVFLFREEAVVGDSPETRGAENEERDISFWQYWNGTSPPPANWMITGAMPVKGENRAVSLLSNRMSPDGAPVRRANVAGLENSWQAAALTVDALRRPGVGVIVPPPAAEPARAASGSPRATSRDRSVSSVAEARGLASPLWMRWKIPLRLVPRGAALLLETSAEATFYVNGAPLLRDWTGMRMIDLGRVLRHGDNYLAVFWPRGPLQATAAISPQSFSRSSLGAPQAASTGRFMPPGTTPLPESSSDEPPLRYEWFFEGTPSDIIEDDGE
jgi:hypothetical protein